MWPSVQPGGVVDKQLTLQPGRYEIYCNVADHQALGMQATFIVRRRE